MFLSGDNCSVCNPADGGRVRQRRHLPQAQGENLWSMCLKSLLSDLMNVSSTSKWSIPDTKLHWLRKELSRSCSAQNQNMSNKKELELILCIEFRPWYFGISFIPIFYWRCSLSDCHFSLPNDIVDIVSQGNQKLRERILIQGTLETLCFEIRIVWYLTLPEVSARGEKMRFNEWKGFAKNKSSFEIVQRKS